MHIVTHYVHTSNTIELFVKKSLIYCDKIPALNETLKETFANFALESAVLEAKSYPPQMQDLVIGWGVGGFVSNQIALMVMDILYGDGTLRHVDRKRKSHIQFDYV